MGKKRKWFAITVLILVMTGCSNTPNNNEALMTNSNKDDRLFNVTITEHDNLLRQGDAHIEQQIPNYRIQDAASSGNKTVRILAGNQEIVKVGPDPSVAPVQGGYTENVLSTAAMYYGTPYEYGSDRSDPSTFDCSDFTRWSFLYSLGMDIPKDSRSQAMYVKTFSKRTYTNIYEARRGDLLFFIDFDGTEPNQYFHKNKSIENISHTGIYLGNGKIIHTASAKTGGVRIDDVNGNHLEWRFVLGGSVLDVD